MQFCCENYMTFLFFLLSMLRDLANIIVKCGSVVLVEEWVSCLGSFFTVGARGSEAVQDALFWVRGTCQRVKDSLFPA